MTQDVEHVRIAEVGPRDGLQNHTGLVVPTEMKVEFIRRLIAAGHKHIEAGAFVRPDRVPQMAQSDEVFGALDEDYEAGLLEGVRLTGLTPNLIGFERACAHKSFGEAAVFTAASDEFNQANIGTTIDGAFERFEGVFDAAGERSIPVRAYISVAFGTLDGQGPNPVQVADIASKLVEMGAYEVSVGDTIGVGTVTDIHSVLDVLIPRLGTDRIALHLHDTRGQALANIHAALLRGIRVFDASSGGLGGCPFAPRATGNVATEDLLYLLRGMGIETGIDADRQMDASWYIEGILGRLLPSRALAAGR